MPRCRYAAVDDADGSDAYFADLFSVLYRRLICRRRRPSCGLRMLRRVSKCAGHQYGFSAGLPPAPSFADGDMIRRSVDSRRRRRRLLRAALLASFLCRARGRRAVAVARLLDDATSVSIDFSTWLSMPSNLKPLAFAALLSARARLDTCVKSRFCAAPSPLSPYIIDFRDFAVD